MTINLADNNPRIAYTVAQGATQQTFAVPFEFFSDSDISVYVDSVLKTEGTHYTLTGGDGSTGNVVFVTATPPDVQQVLGATGGSTVVITRNIPIERTSDFSAGADINRAALNEQLDILTAMIADLKNKVDRSPTLYDYDVVNYQMTIPPTAERSNKYLAFGATGDLVVSSGTTSSIIVSAFGETLIDDANGAAALVTLGLTASSTELNYVDGVTSSIQTQLNAKAPLTGTGTSGTWPISISGDAATTDGKSFGVFTAAGGIAYATSTTQLAAIGAGTTGQVLQSNGASAPSWANSGGVTLLGTLTTTSGSSQTLSGLTLTDYKFLKFILTSVSTTSTGFLSIGGTQISDAGTNTSFFHGIVETVLTGSGFTTAFVDAFTNMPRSSNFWRGMSGYNTSTTSVSISTSTGTFDSGSVLVYGIR